MRARAAVNCLEGVGMIEAPRGVLIHHYKVDEKGAIRWANLIVATGHNNLAINRSVTQVAQHFVDGEHFKEGMLNRVSAVVRAYDPCLSCSTHADGCRPASNLARPDGRSSRRKAHKTPWWGRLQPVNPSEARTLGPLASPLASNHIR